MNIRAWITAVLALCLSLNGVVAEADTSYPSKPVRVVIQYATGGAADLVARVLAAKLSESLGQQFVVESRTGAGGNIATNFVAKSEPDGYTLLLSNDGPITINPGLYSKLPFDVARDLSPIILASSTTYFLVAAPNFPPNSVQELIALARKNPGKFNFASIGSGSNAHLAGERLNSAAGMRLVHIPYKGFPPAVADVMGGKVEIFFASVPSSSHLVKSGKLKALAVTDTKRYPGLPEVPTLIEAGVPEFTLYTWFGLMAPAGTPAAVRKTLRLAVEKALRAKDVAERFDTLGMDIIGAGPMEFGKRIAADTKMWARVIRDSGAKAD